MTTKLAASAASVELSPDDGDIVALLDENVAPNPLAVRDALLELAKLAETADDVKALRAQIVERYDAKVGSLMGRASAIRDSLKVYVERYGKVSFPDVGGVHLTTKDKGGKLTVADAVVFEDYVKTTFPAIAHACTETIEVFNPRDALALVIDEFDVKATPGGSIVDATTGEDKTDAFEKVGVGVVAESKTLAVRKP